MDWAAAWCRMVRPVPAIWATPQGSGGKLADMVQTISGTHLLDPAVIAEPYGFYEELRSEAPVWEVPGAGISRWPHTNSSLKPLPEWRTSLPI